MNFIILIIDNFFMKLLITYEKSTKQLNRLKEEVEKAMKKYVIKYITKACSTRCLFSC